MNLKRTLVKLTLGYLCIIILACGVLSIIIYEVGSEPLDRRLDLRERILIEEPMPPPPEEFMEFMQRRLEPHAVSEIKNRMVTFLIYFNIGVLCIGGLLSYALARRELKPMKEAFDLQSRFTSDAAHELRTPLTAMKAEIEVALRGDALRDGETRELLESNLEEIGKLETLSSSLLKLAQYEEGAGLPTIGSVDASDIIDEAVERVRHAAEARSIDFVVNAEDAAVAGDRVSLVEMLVILVDNSIKYSDDNTTIAIAARRQGRQAVIEVKDQGYGIAEEDLSHVFDRFYRGRLPDAKKRVEGYGLGLSIARRIAEIYHGGIEMMSASGEGTTAIVSLPLARTGPKSDHS